MNKKLKILLGVLIISIIAIGSYIFYNKNQTKTKEIIGTIIEKQNINAKEYDIKVKINDQQEANLKINKNNKILNDLKEKNKYVFIINEDNEILELSK